MSAAETLAQFDVFLESVGLSLDDFFDVLARAWMDEADQIDASQSDGHAAAKSVLESASAHLQQAGLDWYVSTK